MACVGPQPQRMMYNHLSLPNYTQTPEVLTKNYIETTATIVANRAVYLGNAEKAFSCSSVIQVCAA
jgi:hypothetical protein